MELNEQQQSLVNSLDGYICCVACPGSGKSTSILARANTLVKSGVPESSILLMTFTKEAATHMKMKYEKTYGKNNIYFATIHSVCFRALCELRGLDRDNVITDLEKWEFLGKIIEKEVQFNEREDTIRELISQISYVKNKMIPPEDYNLKSDILDKKLFVSAFSSYENYKQAMHKIDFDDMLLIVANTLQTEPDSVRFFQNRWQHIMVDEYQDTNKVQSQIITAVTLNPGFRGSLAVVGDDDQSIYGFRSADSSIMLDFQKIYPDTKVLYLDTNYRSEPEIVKTASKLIDNNTVRFKKDFKAAKTGKADITVKKFDSAMSQANTLVEDFKKMQEKDESLQEVAVLYRTNRQGDLLANRCAKEKIPFYSTESIKDIHNERVFQDILCYYRLSRGIEKKGDLQVILNRPSRYLSSAAFKNCSFNEQDMLNRCSSLKNSKKAEDNIAKMFVDISKLGKIDNAKEFVHYLFDKMGYSNNFVANYAPFVGIDEDEANAQLEIIRDEAEDFDTMDEWFSFAADFAENLRTMKKNRSGVCLSTYHAAKGLEWPTVYLIDVNDGCTPYSKAEEESEIEEERRMFYVAFTRAKEKVRLSFIEKGNETKPSPFLSEMDLLDRVQKGIVPKRKTKKDSKDTGEKKTKRYYAVCAGKKTGVFKTLEECIEQIDGYKDAYFKSFSKKKDAEKFLERILAPQSTKGKINANEKVYAVKSGHKKGIYRTWSDCQKQIEGYSGAKYRRFKSIEEAEKYLAN